MEDGMKKTKLRKSLQHYLCKKLKKIPPISIPSSTIPASIASRRLLSTCRFPRTPSFDADDPAAGNGNGNGRDHAATLSDVDRFLFDNFRSLYIHDCDDDAPTPLANAEASSSSSSSEAAAEDTGKGERGGGSGGGAAVVVFSVDPYTDFRRSLRSMIAMHHGEGEGCEALDWDFLEELLFYYLQLNDQCVHKHILKSFADLTAGARHGGGCAGRGKARAHWADKSVRSRKY